MRFVSVYPVQSEITVVFVCIWLRAFICWNVGSVLQVVDEDFNFMSLICVSLKMVLLLFWSIQKTMGKPRCV